MIWASKSVLGWRCWSSGWSALEALPEIYLLFLVLLLLHPAVFRLLTFVQPFSFPLLLHRIHLLPHRPLPLLRPRLHLSLSPLKKWNIIHFYTFSPFITQSHLCCATIWLSKQNLTSFVLRIFALRVWVIAAATLLLPSKLIFYIRIAFKSLFAGQYLLLLVFHTRIYEMAYRLYELFSWFLSFPLNLRLHINLGTAILILTLSDFVRSLFQICFLNFETLSLILSIIEQAVATQWLG